MLDKLRPVPSTASATCDDLPDLNGELAEHVSVSVRVIVIEKATVLVDSPAEAATRMAEPAGQRSTPGERAA